MNSQLSKPPPAQSRGSNLSAIALGLLVTLAASAALSSPAAAQRQRPAPSLPGVTVSVAPNPDAEANPYAYLFELRATDWQNPEVVADRRLLSFAVHVEGRRRPLTCRHPDAPRRASAGRVRVLGPGNGEDGEDGSVWRETIDLRMYCWGRTLRALSAGARVEVRYGFGRRPRRGTWVARVGRTTESPGRGQGEFVLAPTLSGADFQFAQVPEGGSGSEAEPGAADPADADTDAAEPAVAVAMRPIDVSRGAAVAFRPRVRSTGAPVRVYVRDDLFRFRIRGPLGETVCALVRTPIAPIIDFFTRLGGRRTAGGTVSVPLACPDAFMVAGIYEVTPIVDLDYGSGQYELDDVVTGSFSGEAALVRIRRGDRGYVEQVPGAGTAAP